MNMSSSTVSKINLDSTSANNNTEQVDLKLPNVAPDQLFEALEERVCNDRRKESRHLRESVIDRRKGERRQLK
jgi:hypothetical protein